MIQNGTLSSRIHFWIKNQAFGEIFVIKFNDSTFIPKQTYIFHVFPIVEHQITINPPDILEIAKTLTYHQ